MSIQAKFEEEEEKIEKELQNARSSLTKYETELTMKKDQMVRSVSSRIISLNNISKS